MSENSLVGKNLFNKTHKSKIEICKRLNKLIISKVNKMVFIIKYTKSKKNKTGPETVFVTHRMYRGFISIYIVYIEVS